MTKLDCTFDEKGSGNTAAAWFSDGNTRTEISLFAFDSTGLKPTNRGDWMTAKWGTRRGFIKLHVGVDTRTKNSNPRCARSSTCESLGHPHHAHEELNLAWVKPPYSAARVIICV